MKELLEAVKAELKNRLTYVRNVYITPDLGVMPQAVSFPAIGIKDGEEKGKDHMGGGSEQVLNVELVITVKHLAATEDLVIGRGANKGVLDVADDVREALHGNLLNISGMIDARLITSKPSGIYINQGKTEYMQAKELVFAYEKEVH